MATHKRKNDDAPIHIYRPTAIMQIAYVGGLIFLVLHFCIFMTVWMQTSWIFLFFIPLYLFGFWTLVVHISQQHLAVYENGLEYRIGGNRFFSHWEDMQRFERRSFGRSSVIGIYTLRLERESPKNWLETLVTAHHENFLPLSTVSIPIRWDGCWSGSVVDTDKLLETEFGQDLLHYAPQLFDYGNERRKNG